MATIGMEYPVYSPITTYTPGSAITYGTGKVLAKAIAASITQNRRDNPLYADNGLAENDRGMTDYTLSLEVDDLSITDRAALLGEVAITGTTTTSHYAVVDVDPPYVGFGYIRNRIVGGAKKVEAYWFHRCQFVQGTEEAKTKGKEIEWGTYKLEGTGFGAVLDSTNGTQFYDHMEFETEAAAKAWLNGKAGITG